MRYRLRTLLIVIAIFAIVFARVAYLKQSAAAHRRQAGMLVQRLAENERYSPEEVRHHAAFFIQDTNRITHRVLVNHAGRFIHLDSDSGRGQIVQFAANTRDWKQLYAHEIIARRFDHAVFRPWTLVQDDTAAIIGR
jgi:hypothetical protein